MRTTTQGFISPALALQTVSHRSAVSAVMYTNPSTVVRRADLIVLPPVVREIRTAPPMAAWLVAALKAKPVTAAPAVAAATPYQRRPIANHTEWVGPDLVLQIGRPRHDIELRPKKMAPRKCRHMRNCDYQPGRRDHFERRALRQFARTAEVFGGVR